MGNNQTRSSAVNLFTQDELKILETTFRACGGYNEKLEKDKLLDVWKGLVDTGLATYMANHLFTQTKQKSGCISFRRFCEPFYIVCRATIDMQVNLIVGSIAGDSMHQFAIKDLENYVITVVRTYLHMQTSKDTHVTTSDSFHVWHQFGFLAPERSLLAFSRGLIRHLAQDSEYMTDVVQLERWLHSNPIFLSIWKDVVAYMYAKPANKPLRLLHESAKNIVPACEGLTKQMHYQNILDLPHLIYINSNLPPLLRHKWRFLFSSKIMGESFSTMLGKILNVGPTLLIIEDEDQYAFAGFAPHSWKLGPLFTGDNSAMLFTLSPAMRCFSATDYNDHYQYLNLNQQTMPNGLGMGGQFNYWGLWLDHEYGKGQSSESCTTFRDYVQLSKRKDFRIRNMEVWGIGDLPKVNEDDEEEGAHGTGKRTILDRNLEDRTMLELSGHKIHSDGLREPDRDLYPDG